MKFANEQDKERFESAVAANLSAIVEAGYEEKYKGYGIYCIKVDDMIVYIGKSRDCLQRVAQHMTEIELNTTKNMYNVLRTLKESHKIGFDIMTKTDEDDDQLGLAEAYAIRRHSPCLNIQYPKMEDYHKFDYCKRAKTITAKEVEEILDNNKKLSQPNF